MKLPALKLSQNVTAVLLVVLVLLVSVLSSEIEYQYPLFLRNALEEPLFKLVVLLFVIYMTYQNFTLGLLLALIFVFSVTNVRTMSQVSEGFENGSPLAHCGTYNTDIKKVGTVYYPMHDNQNTRRIRKGNDTLMDKF